LLDLLDIPYQCTHQSVLALTMDKWLTKKVWQHHHLPVASDIILDHHMSEDDIYTILFRFNFHCVCKALDQGSSQGMIIVSSVDQIFDVYVLVQQFGRVMCEEFVDGDECTVAILDDEALPVVEIIPPHGQQFDYENKYSGQTMEICPARYDIDLTAEIQSCALQAYHAVGCTGYGRVDMIVSKC
jgi:D-alanine-D-alanine ligase